MRKKKKVFLIVDGHAILHRAFHALPPLTNREGQPVGAVFGFFSTLLAIIKQFSPSWLAVCLDTPAPTFRHQEFVGYQAKRPPLDKSLIPQLRVLKKILKKAGVATFARAGFEADDLIATLAHQVKKKTNAQILVFTGDKDLMQLVDQRVHLLSPQRGLSGWVIFTPKKVEEKLGVPPRLVVDFKALVGDSSDNYPGVEGIGPKTAVSLLKKYHSLENIYHHCGDFSENMRKKLEQGREAAFLSQKLAQVVHQVPVKIDLNQAKLNPKRLKTLKQTLAEFRFPSLAQRIEKNLLGSIPKGRQMSLV